MLIVFDLDDTLIDTSSCLVPQQLLLALRAMINQGLKINSEKKAFSLLRKINQQSLSGKEALTTFLKRIRSSSNFLKIGLAEYYGNIQINRIRPFPDTLFVLKKLKKKHRLVLLTKGIKHQQHQKIVKAGINSNWFCQVVVTKAFTNKDYYFLFGKENDKKQVLVCSDLFKSDLLPAQKLGAVTVHLLQGRGKREIIKPNKADYTIKRLKQLIPIVDKLNKKCKP